MIGQFGYDFECTRAQTHQSPLDHRNDQQFAVRRKPQS